MLKHILAEIYEPILSMCFDDALYDHSWYQYFRYLKNSRLLLWINKNKYNMNLRLVPLNRPGCELYNGVSVYDLSNVLYKTDLSAAF
jgi:hypothetical protein